MLAAALDAHLCQYSDMRMKPNRTLSANRGPRYLKRTRDSKTFNENLQFQLEQLSCHSAAEEITERLPLLEALSNEQDHNKEQANPRKLHILQLVSVKMAYWGSVKSLLLRYCTAGAKSAPAAVS